MPRFVRLPLVCLGLVGLVSGCGSDDVAKVEGTPSPTTPSAEPAAKGKRGPKASDGNSVTNTQLRD